MVPVIRVSHEYRPGYNCIQCGFCERNTKQITAQISTDNKNRNFTLLTLCILCLNETYTSSSFEISGPANGTEVSFPIPTLTHY